MRYAKSVFALNATAIFTLLVYIVGAFCQNSNIAYIFLSMYFAGLTWLLIIIKKHALIIAYARPYKRKKLLNYLLYFFALADTVSYVVNIFTHQIFTISKYDYYGNVSCNVVDMKWSCVFHLVLCYMLALSILAILLRRIVGSHRLFRIKYLTILGMFVGVIIINVLFYVFDWKLDYSVFFYALTAILSIHLAHHALPRDFIASMQITASENITSAVFCFDKDGNPIYQNQLADRLYDSHFNKDKLVKILNGSGEANLELMLDGQERFFVAASNSIYDSKNVEVGKYIKLDDRTDDAIRINREKNRADYDSLTNIYNRPKFFKEASRVIAESPNRSRYLVCTNVKDFKLINDLLGTEYGDRIIIEIARELTNLKYEDCVQGRISADKFAILINKSDFDADEFIGIVERIKSMTTRLRHKLHMYIGVYEIANPSENVQTMYDKANLAIRNVKGDYSKTIVFYDTYLMEKLVHDKNVVSEFQRALDNNEFIMYLQPQVDKLGKVIGAETLVRWKHPVRGLMSPSEFVGTLETAGYIYSLDRYVWELAARKLEEWQKKGIDDMYLSVNISARDFYYMDLVEIFMDLVKRYEINPKKLNLEITETALIEDLKTHSKVIDRLRDCGFSIEMDDFGSGYSSLNVLKDVKMDVLKIDMEFLSITDNTDKSNAILTSLISMAKRLGMMVVVEGVENPTQQSFLVQAGADIFQGYYFSKPLSVTDFEEKFVWREN